MTLTDLSRMFVSEREGWRDIQRMHPGITMMMLAVVGPLSLLPPLMYAYANMAHPGAVFPLLEPGMTGGEAMLIGGIFFLIEIAMVFMMADMIRQISNAMSCEPSYAQCFAMAAIAPIPLWLTSLMLFVPSLWFNVAMVAIAWFGSAALIRHGVGTLLEVDDAEAAHHIANRVTFAGVIAWLALMVMMALIASIIFGWR